VLTTLFSESDDEIPSAQNISSNLEIEVNNEIDNDIDKTETASICHEGDTLASGNLKTTVLVDESELSNDNDECESLEGKTVNRILLQGVLGGKLYLPSFCKIISFLNYFKIGTFFIHHNIQSYMPHVIQF